MPKQTQTIDAVENGTAFTITQDFDYSVSGTFTGTVQLQRSFDGGTTYKPCASDITAETESYMVHRGGEALYRFAGTAWTSGSAACVANIKD